MQVSYAGSLTGKSSRKLGAAGPTTSPERSRRRVSRRTPHLFRQLSPFRLLISLLQHTASIAGCSIRAPPLRFRRHFPLLHRLPTDPHRAQSDRGTPPRAAHGGVAAKLCVELPRFEEARPRICGLWSFSRDGRGPRLWRVDSGGRGLRGVELWHQAGR